MADTCNDYNPFVINELEALYYELRSVLLSDRSKHSADIIASKAVILPRLDRMGEILSSYKHMAKSCAECPLWKRHEDMRVASETIDRIIRYSQHNEFCVTRDEAENLRKIFEGNYTERTKD